MREEVGDFLTGVGAAVNENMGWGNTVNAQPGFVDAYNNGRTAGNLISVVVGAGEVAAGALGITTSAGAEVGSAGLATPVAAVTAAGSATLVAHGGKTAMNAIDNLTNDKGRVNASQTSKRVLILIPMKAGRNITKKGMKLKHRSRQRKKQKPIMIQLKKLIGSHLLIQDKRIKMNRGGCNKTVDTETRTIITKGIRLGQNIENKTENKITTLSHI